MGCRDVSCNDACKSCTTGCKVLVTLNYSTMTDALLAPGPAHRTVCPTNIWCSERIWGLYCSLGTGGGGIVAVVVVVVVVVAAVVVVVVVVGLVVVWLFLDASGTPHFFLPFASDATTPQSY